MFPSGRDPPGLVMREHARLPRLVLVLPKVGVGDGLVLGRPRPIANPAATRPAPFGC